MAKLNSGKMIVIKINGERRSFHEESVPIDAERVKNMQHITADQVAFTPPDQALVEAAASNELTDESFEWIPPEEEENPIESSDFVQPQENHYLSQGKKQTGSLKRIGLSVIFAVLLGTGFGILMLKLVSTEQVKQTRPAVPSAPANQKNGAPDSPSAPAFTLKQWTAFVVQGGVYSSKESVKIALGQASDKGIPADSIEINGRQYIMIGIADTSEKAKSLGSYLQQQGFADVYPRSLTIPEKQLSGLNADEKAFIKDAAALFPILTRNTSDPMDSGAITKETINRVSELEMNITKIGSRKFKNGKLRKLASEINAASLQLKSYQNNNDSNKLAKAQQHLLTFLSIYYSL